MSSVALNLILDKISSADKDFRYMATSDLARELKSSHLVLDDFETQKIISAVLKQLNDSSGDISGLANTCLGTLVGKVDAKHLDSMCAVLLDQMKGDKDGMRRDIAYLGVKTVIQNIGVYEHARVTALGAAEFLGPRLMACVVDDKEEVTLNGYDLLLVFLTQHGPLFPDMCAIADTCVGEFDNARPGIRKKAMQCLGKMAASLPGKHFDGLCRKILENMRQHPGTSAMNKVQTMMMAMSYIARGAGYRMDAHIQELLSLCFDFVGAALEDEDGVDLVESCLVVLELCVSKCPGSTENKRSDIAKVAGRCIRYDPNYAADSDMEEDEPLVDSDMGDEEEQEEEEDYDDEDAFSDDDDSSWKVRRAASKLICTEVKQYPTHVSDLYDLLQPILIKRAISEREDTVRQDIFNSYLELIKVVDADSKDDELVQKFDRDAEDVVVKFARLVKKQTVQTKCCVYKALHSMVVMRPALFSLVLPKLSSDIVACLQEDSAFALQVQVLECIEAGFDGMSGPDNEADLVKISEEVLECAKKKYFASAAIALKTCRRLVHLIRPDVSQPVPQNLAGLVLPLFLTISDVLSVSDKPQEVKNAAIDCAAESLAWMGDLLEGTQVEALAKDFAAMPSNTKRAKIQGPSEDYTGHLPRLKDIVAVLIEKLNNETTRLSALRALKKIIDSPLHLDVQDALDDAISSIKSYLKKLDRQLRILSVETLSSVITCKDGALGSEELNSIIDELAPLISDDLGVSNAVMDFLENAADTHPDMAFSMLERVFSNIQQLMSSPTLQKASLEKLRGFLSKTLNQIPAHRQEVIEKMFNFGMQANSKNASIAASTCVAQLAQPSQDACHFVEREVLEAIKNPAQDVKIFCLYCIKDMGVYQFSLNKEAELRQAVLDCLPEEATSEAAAIALGGLASKNSSDHLDFVLGNLSQTGDKKNQYHMLKALNEGLEIVSSNDACNLDPSKIKRIVEILIERNTDDQNNEEVRSIIADCYGHASLISPDVVLPTFAEQLKSPDSRSKIMALMGLRNATLESEHRIDDQLAATWIPEALQLMSDPDVSVRRAATLLLSLAAHNKFKLVAPLLATSTPPLLEQTKPDPNLVRVINLGPFKHKVDDGLEQRKSAFDCLGILISKCWNRLPEHDAIADAIVSGCTDQYDVKLKCHDLIISIAHQDPILLLSRLERMVDPFTSTLTAKVKSDAVRQEVDRNEDMIRSCLRAVDALERIEGASDVIGWKTFIDTCVKSKPLLDKYMGIVRERKQAEGI